MTKERSGFRNLDFSNWIRDNEPADVKGFTNHDIDHVFRNYLTKEITIVEEKCYCAKVKEENRFTYADINKIFKAGCEALGWKFKGFHLLQFENTSPDNGRIFFDHKEITKEQLIDIIYRFKL